MKYLKLSVFALAFLVLISTVSVFAQTRTRGYTTRRGTYVSPHKRTTPNKTRMDNYSTRGNRNPYTGKRGTKSPYKTRRY